MVIEVTDLASELDATAVQQRQEELAQLMSEFDSTIDTRRGVLHDVLFYLQAIYAEKNATELARLKRSQSLLEASQDPTLADAETIDNIASNFRITRSEAQTATGSITIAVSDLAPLSIAAGTVWEANGIQFTNVETYNAVTSNSQATSSNDRVLNPTNSGTYEFSIPLSAVNAGTSGLVVKDTLFVPQTTPPGFAKAFASSDFTGGADEETNAQLIDRLLQGAACKALSGSTSMEAALREEFSSILATSIIGFGDTEMLRDQHSIFPGSHGGRIDWYVRTQERAQNLGLTKEASLVEIASDGDGLWQAGVGRDEAPGFFDVLSITPAGESDSTTLQLIDDTRSADLTALDNDGFLPDIDVADEAVYSRFQSAVIQFATTPDDVDLSSSSVGDTAEFDFTLRTMPSIGDIQDWVSGRGVRNRAGDALVKAPIPCFVSASFTVFVAPSQVGSGETASDAIDISQIQNDVAELINRYGFTGRLPTSAIADIIHDSLTGSTFAGAISLLADIRFPDGEIRRIHTTDILVVPDEPERMVSARTVAFFTTPDDIAVSAEIADIPDI